MINLIGRFNSNDWRIVMFCCNTTLPPAPLQTIHFVFTRDASWFSTSVEWRIRWDSVFSRSAGFVYFVSHRCFTDRWLLFYYVMVLFV